MRASLRVTLGTVAAAALALGGLALGVSPAAAQITPAPCDGPGDGIIVKTGGGLWWSVCLESGNSEDGLTPHKTDAFDGIGDLFLNYGDADEVELVADFEPLVEEFDGGEVQISWTDFDVAYDVADLVDVQVLREIKGTTQQWTFTVTDSDDGAARPDVTVSLTGNLGSDGSALYDTVGSNLVAYGDVNDPIVAFEGFGVGYSFNWANPDPDDFWFSTRGTSAGLTVALVDYGCDNYEDAIEYTLSEVATDVDARYGETIVTPGTVSCMTAASPIHLTTGAAFNIPINVTFGPEFDFSQGGVLVDWYDNIYEWTEWVETGQNLPGVTPTLAMTGTAPTEPGTYYMYVYGYSNVNDIGDQALIEVIVEKPQLAATGSELSPIALGSALMLLFAGAATLTVVRRRRAQL